MQELIDLSRAVAAELAAEFRGDPRGELAAWLHIALEREGLVASLYERHSVESRLQSLPKQLVRSVLAKVNGICTNEETHVTAIRALLAAVSPWSQVMLEEGWGRLEGFVLGQLAGTNAFTQAIALILLELGARSDRERAAGRAVTGLDVGGFLKFSRTLEVTAVESYQQVVALLAALRRNEPGSPRSLALHLKLLRILRDERVHRDVFHVLSGAFGGDGAPPQRSDDSEPTELPSSITTRPISSRADLNEVCRAILTFHYGVVLPAGAPRTEAIRTAVDYWRWQMENPRRKSYLVDCQRQDVFFPAGDILLLGTAGLQHVARGPSSIRSLRFDRRLIPRCVAEGESLARRSSRVEPQGCKNPKMGYRRGPAQKVSANQPEGEAPHVELYVRR
jgi:hypothetical protein